MDKSNSRSLEKSASKERDNGIVFDDMVSKSKDHKKNFNVDFPISTNLIQNVATNKELQYQIEDYARRTQILVHNDVSAFIAKYIEEKAKTGTDIEKEIYQEIIKKKSRRISFFERSQLKRPIAFLMKSDKALLRTGFATSGGFEIIGTKEETTPLLMKDYQTYDEMQISALLSIASPTFFINKGDRNNKGVHAEKGTFEEKGYFVGMIGARFEKPGYMEYQHILVTPEQNIEKNGYGEHGEPEKKKWLDLWAGLYKTEVFHTYHAVEKYYDDSKHGKETYFKKEIHSSKPHYINIPIYKKRMNFVIEPFLYYCNTVAAKENKKAYVHNVGLGLGVWQCASQQNEWLCDVYWDILKKNSITKHFRY